MKFRLLLSKISHLALLCAAVLAGTAFSQTSASALGDFSGMYTFLREGEFVQITLDELPNAAKPKVPVTGFVSRFGASESDRDQVLDLMFKSGTLDGARISFATRVVHGISYEFSGSVRRGEAKSKDKEGFIVIEGTLIESRVETGGKTRAKKRHITMKSFPNLDDPDELPPCH